MGDRRKEPNGVNFVFCVHNHQPVDNFDHVFQKAYADAYKPFFDVMQRHPTIKFCAHFSGPLLEWIEKNRLEMFMSLRAMADAGRLELLGGGFYEPVFAMLPDGDVLGQIEMMSRYLRKNFGADAQGLWIPERVWEPGYASILARSGARYAVLDDFHFRAAGLRDEELRSWFITEDRGEIFRVFPLREALRYSIPFREPEATIDYLRAQPEGSIVVYADDGEKFGVWPRTKKHCYEDGWLERFLRALESAPDIRTTTFREALASTPAAGRVYLPACSYREMGEWSMLPGAQPDFEKWIEEVRRQGRFDAVKHFSPGGTWRNFRAKYPEANLMYGRMLGVSKKVAEAPPAARKAAEPELYRAQCNCGHWHGVFGGLYLPHLRNSIYRHLILAENALESDGTFGYKTLDLDLDGREDYRLHNKALNLFILPAQGARLAEMDVRPRAVNLTAGLSRRRETYHEKVRRAVLDTGEAKSIHDVVLTKVAGIERHLEYDRYTHASLLDHFFEPGATIEDVAAGRREMGDFLEAPYRGSAIRKGPRVVAEFVREGFVRPPGGAPVPVRVRKEAALEEDRPEFTVEYAVRNLGTAPLSAEFGVEFFLAALSATQPDAFLHRGDFKPAGALGEAQDLPGGRPLWVFDSWHDLNLGIFASGDAGFRVAPIRTVSMSEGGFELIYQGTVVMPRWAVTLEPEKEWHAVVTHKVGLVDRDVR
ncbi:MAG: DUF1926 domain-containing protein [Planctomycetes bacterium]|nr:DUF1926 domain-containing protein [Planctomycetota bacterium]